MILTPLLNEQALLEQVAAGNEKAFRLLFDHYWGRIYEIAYAFTKSAQLAEELTQDIFLKIWSGRSSLSEIRKFDAYLYTIARNQIFNELRRKIREIPYTENLLEYFRKLAESPEEQMIVKETEEQLNQVIDQLPSQQQLIYRMSREEGLSQEEIAQKLNITVHTVKSHMNKALNTIRRTLFNQADGRVIVVLFALLIY